MKMPEFAAGASGSPSIAMIMGLSAKDVPSLCGRPDHAAPGRTFENSLHFASLPRGDCVLRHENPLSDIRNTTAVEFAILQAKVLHRKTLGEIPERTKENAAPLRISLRTFDE